MKAKRPLLRRNSMTSRRKVSIVLILLLVLASHKMHLGTLVEELGRPLQGVPAMVVEQTK